jgi:hypothetical protein
LAPSWCRPSPEAPEGRNVFKFFDFKPIASEEVKYARGEPDDMLIVLAPTLLLILSVLATAAAVASGVAAFRADRKASPRDEWTAPARTKPISQSERLTETLSREIERRKARSRTYAGGAFWLAASAFAAASALQGVAVLVAAIFGIMLCVLAVVAVVAVVASNANDWRWKNERSARVTAVETILNNARRSDRQPLTIEQQLAEWSDNADLRVFVMYQSHGPTTTTYQGQLVFETNGVGGWNIRAHDWNLGAVDSTSVFRGVALNLHGYSESRWQPGNGTFGASCRFYRRAFVAQRLPNGSVDGLEGIVETLTIRVDDPFEIMPFLNSGMGQTRPAGPPPGA